MLWGWSFATWESIIKLSLWIAAVAGIATAFFAFVAGYVGYELADAVSKLSEEKVAIAAANAAAAKVDVAEANAEVAKSNQRIAQLDNESAKLRADAETARAAIADANARAAEALQQARQSELELAKIKLPRIIDTKHADEIISIAKLSPGTKFTMAAFNDPESISLMSKIADLLVANGWIESAWIGGDIVMARGSRPSFGVTFVSGLYVQADKDSKVDYKGIVFMLSHAISGTNFAAKGEIGTMPANTNKDVIHILVGQKSI